jgi:molybdopterin adenylyltransferase
MNIPDKFEVLVITLSDRAYRGDYVDLSGPLVKKKVEEHLSELGWNFNITTALIPDDADTLRELLKSARHDYNIIFTTGGTGIGPRDITVETVSAFLEIEIPGIMDFIRVRYGLGNPNALLSRSVAGIAGKALIYTLPGSVRAAGEYMDEIVKTLKHTVYMQYGIDRHD